MPSPNSKHILDDMSTALYLQIWCEMPAFQFLILLRSALSLLDCGWNGGRDLWSLMPWNVE
jgi:hypothetical protein